jgi:hypothetical protein
MAFINQMRKAQIPYLLRAWKVRYDWGYWYSALY